VTSKRLTICISLITTACLFALHGVADRPPTPGRNLLRNPGFEQHNGIGTIPTHWQAIDEHIDYFGWIAPRAERIVGNIGPRSGRYLAGLDLDMLGVDTNDKGYHIPRAALFQTVEGRGQSNGTFSLHYNDLESSALSHIAAIRLAYTVNHTAISDIRFPADSSPEPTLETASPDIWSKPFFRVSQRLPHSQTAVGDWTRAAIPVVVKSTDERVRLTLWIGIFDHQNSTEVAYYRIDDASFVIDSVR